jgi:hypothetical protein
MNQANRNTSQGTPVISSFTVVVARVTWFFLGPAALLLLAAKILGAGSGWFTLLDALFFVVLGIIIGARWFEQKSGHGTTTEGKPSTWVDVQRYSVRLTVVAVAIWIVCNLFGNHILAG